MDKMRAFEMNGLKAWKLCCTVVMALASLSIAGQTERPAVRGEVGPIRSSAAYSEVLLRKTELLSDLESIVGDYTEENPKVIDIRYELGLLNKEIDRLFGVKPTETSKLTEALGKMIVRKVSLETDLARLRRAHKDDYPDVKRMKRKVEIFEAAVKEVLG